MNFTPADQLLLQQYFAGIPVKKAYLFGSVACGEANKESDLDILVELDDTHPIGMKFFVFQSDLEELMQKKVALISTEGISLHIKPFIDRDKILIYDRKDSFDDIMKCRNQMKAQQKQHIIDIMKSDEETGLYDG